MAARQVARTPSSLTLVSVTGSKRKTWEERTRSNIFLGVLLLLSAVLSAALLFGNTGRGVIDWVRTTRDWRDQEYNKLTSLHAGYTRKKFESVLGEPVFDRRSKDGRFREQSFKRREHWVQTVSDRDGSVVLYSVTACGADFRPTFRVAVGLHKEDPDRSVELNATEYASVLGPGRISELDYYTGNTANSRFYEIMAGGNPDNYKTYVWGLNDVCPGFYLETLQAVYKRSRVPRDQVAIYRGRVDRAPAWAKRLRQEFAVNTYAEVAPTFDLDKLRGEFQVGVDRILTRTTE